MEFKDLIKNRRKEINITLEEIGKRVGVSKATVQRWESGEIKNVRRDKIAKLANALQTTPAYLMGWEESAERFPSPSVTEDYTTFPVVGEIAAGYDHIAIENWEGDKIDIPNSYLKGRKPSEFFVLLVKGESMYPTYQDGDKVLILKQGTMNYSGQIGAIMYEDDCATLKRVEYVSGEDWMKLVPINPTFPPIKIENEALEHCHVLGIPKLVIREIT